MTGREKFKKYKFFLSLLSNVYRIFPLNLRKKLLQFHRFTSENIGIAIRYSLLLTIAKKCGDNVAIHSGCYILNPEDLIIGNNVSINPMCYIDATGGIEIGDNVSIAHGVTIMSTSHSYEGNLDIPIKYKPFLSKKVIIEENVWIGSKATILYGNCVGKGSVIGASTLVNKDIPFNSIAVGVPVKVIKERN